MSTSTCSTPGRLSQLCPHVGRDVVLQAGTRGWCSAIVTRTAPPSTSTFSTMSSSVRLRLSSGSCTSESARRTVLSSHHIPISLLCPPTRAAGRASFVPIHNLHPSIIVAQDLVKPEPCPGHGVGSVLGHADAVAITPHDKADGIAPILDVEPVGAEAERLPELRGR